MENLPIGLADIAVAAILLLSALLAYGRGLVREVLAVAVWIGAGGAALYGYAFARPYAEQIVSLRWMADVGTAVALFLLAFVLITLLTRPIAGRVRDSDFRGLDRALGFLFGLVRGAAVVSLAFLLLTWLLPTAEQPDWLRSARSRPYVERGAGILKALVPERTRAAGADAASEAGQRLEGGVEVEILDQLTKPRTKSAKDGDRPGYSEAERRDMKRLLQSSQ